MFLVLTSTGTRHKYLDQISVDDCVDRTRRQQVWLWNAFWNVSDPRHSVYGSAWMSQWNMRFTLSVEGQVRGHRGIVTVYKIEKRVEVEGNCVFKGCAKDPAGFKSTNEPNKDIHSYTSRCYTIIDVKIHVEQFRELKTIQNPLVPIPNLDLCVQSCPDAIDEVFKSKLHIIGGVGIGIGVIMVNTLYNCIHLYLYI